MEVELSLDRPQLFIDESRAAAAGHRAELFIDCIPRDFEYQNLEDDSYLS